MKYMVEFNKDTNPSWYEDEKFNKMFMECQKLALWKILRADGVLSLKEALKGFGFITKGIAPEILWHYWDKDLNESIDDFDIEIVMTADGAHITFETDY